MPSLKVSIVRCDSYSQDAVDAAVRRSIDHLGGIERYVKKGDRVLLKPNLLIGASPDECVTTNPAVVVAVGRVLKDLGCTITIADSPGSFLPYTEDALRKVYDKCGMLNAARELGAQVNYGTGSQEVLFDGGRSLKSFKAIDPVLEADAVIVVSKLKTHLATGLTGAAKNIYGVVPGLEKKAVHARLRTPDKFADAIVDLNERLCPRLQVMDAVMAMEGDGPTSGSPKAMNAILAGTSPYAVDAVAARLVRFDPLRVTTIGAAAGRGLIDLNAVEVVGETVDSMTVPDFVLPSTFTTGGSGSKLKTTIASIISRSGLDRTRPVVSAQACVGCGSCAKSCPAGAIHVVERKASIDRSKCIECYCCHEMCTNKAIKLEKGAVGRMVDRVVARKSSG